MLCPQLKIEADHRVLVAIRVIEGGEPQNLMPKIGRIVLFIFPNYNILKIALLRYSPFSDMACVYRWLATSEPRSAGSGLAVSGRMNGVWTSKDQYGSIDFFRAYLPNSSKNCAKVT